MFTCCHPALATEAQVALTLRLLGGLETGPLFQASRARADDGPTPGRAERKIRDARIPYGCRGTPSCRTACVEGGRHLSIFNEVHPQARRELGREDLAAEAIRLARPRDLDEPGSSAGLLLLSPLTRPPCADRSIVLSPIRTDSLDPDLAAEGGHRRRLHPSACPARIRSRRHQRRQRGSVRGDTDWARSCPASTISSLNPNPSWP
jgi:RNA polymerase sigma-70 factor (ECF subfamily)